jgi:antitoxin ParD1/3/4
MADIERLTITLPSEMAAAIKSAVAGGDYASTSEVVREAVRDWKLKRALRLQELEALKADINRGLADVAAGRVKKFDPAWIIQRGNNCMITNYQERAPPVYAVLRRRAQSPWRPRRRKKGAVTPAPL